MKKIFVDGQEGTTGLQIRERLAVLKGIELLEIEPELRKDIKRKTELLNSADVAILCLPDDAAKESASLVTNPNTVIIDTSTAHRTNEDWDYGLPELSKCHSQAIKNSKRIANPGCHATGFLLAVYPLLAKGILKRDDNLSCYSLTGYSGGGKKMISDYENQSATLPPKIYALNLQHKHLPEMQKIAGLINPPLFNPVVGHFYKGMIVSVALFNLDFDLVRDTLKEHYKNSEFVSVANREENPKELFPTMCNDTNNAKVFVFQNGEVSSSLGQGSFGQISVVLDNLGKGASGAAVQNLLLALPR